MRGLKRWLKRLAGLAALLFVGFAGYQAIDRHLTRRAGEEQLAAVVAGLDAADPGWRLDELLVAREARFPPADRNPMRLVQQIDSYPAFLTWPPAGEDWRRGDPNRRPADAHTDALACLRDECRPATDRLQPLKGMPPGGYPLVVTPDVIGTNLAPTQKAREAAGMLEVDAVAAALAGDPDRAVSSAHACLAAGRGIGDEPFLISMLIRTAIDILAARTAERVLGLTQPRAGLPELQAALLAEADAPVLADALRGERAMMDRVFEGVDAGRISLRALADGRDPVPFGEGALTWLYQGKLPTDRAAYLGVLTQYVAAARRPPHERLAAVQAVPLPPKDFDHILTRLLLPAIDKVTAADLRGKALLRCAALGIACERFRWKTGRWPAAVADLRDFLPALPLDPFTGTPLRLLRRSDGLTVYAVGPDGTDHGGQTLTADGKPGTDVGFRLWDITHRAAEPEDQP